MRSSHMGQDWAGLYSLKRVLLRHNSIYRAFRNCFVSGHATYPSRHEGDEREAVRDRFSTKRRADAEAGRHYVDDGGPAGRYSIRVEPRVAAFIIHPFVGPVSGLCRVVALWKLFKTPSGSVKL